jgi:outer membrane protein TolC
MKKNNLLVLIALMLGTGANGQDSINYLLFLERIRMNHPIVQYAKNVGRSGDVMLRSAQGNFDPVLSADYEEKFFDGKNYYTSTNAYLKQPVFASHALTAGYNYMQGAYTNPQLQTPASGTPFLGVETSLLQGFMMDKRRYELLKARYNQSYYQADQKVLTNEVLYQASMYYFEWLYSIREQEIHRYFTLLAAQRLQGIKVLAGEGEMAPVDSIEAAILYRSRSLDLQSVSIKSNQKATGVLNNNWIESVAVSSAELIPSDSFDYWFMKVKVSRIADDGDSSTTNPLLLKFNYQRSMLEAEKKFRAEMVKPRLDVKYNFLSTSGPNDNWTLNPNNYKWGVNFSLPLLMRTSRSDLMLAKLKIRNNDFQFLNKQTELTSKTNLIRQNINLLEQQLENAQTNLNYSRVLLEAEKQKFEQGESSLFLLNTRESKWMEAELKLAEYRHKYIQHMLELIYLRGDLSYGW